jgi:hypothetical protein
MRRILLVEPGYRNTYPPLGLMKISSYHKRRGDFVRFVKGLDPAARREQWDRVYVSTLFTFHWRITIQTINYYRPAVTAPDAIYVGGVLATLLADEVRAETGATVVSGLLDRTGILDPRDRTKVDVLVPDYDLLTQTPYRYGLQNAYLGYATRGCPNSCAFCAVRELEPTFQEYLPLKRQVQAVDELYGPKRDLVLLDNNVLASDQFERIIADIKTLGFERGARFTYASATGRPVSAQRRVDFNQGVDARLLTDAKMGRLSEIAIRPLRIAFDDIAQRHLYVSKVRLAARHGVRSLSNYILYNYHDHPDDFYDRLRINVALNEELGLSIFSFPMRYIDLHSKDRSPTTLGNLGRHWNRKHLRAIQCVLVRTRGIVGSKLDYFEAAFGRNYEEYHKILLMPEAYIIHRRDHEADGSTDRWWRQVCGLTPTERQVLLSIVHSNDFRSIDYSAPPRRVRQVLDHYYTGRARPVRRARRPQPELNGLSVTSAV